MYHRTAEGKRTQYFFGKTVLKYKAIKTGKKKNRGEQKWKCGI